MARNSDDYDVSNKFSLLIQGIHGTGKTTLAAHFPKPYIIDCDDNLCGAMRGLRDKGIKFKWDTPLLDSADNRINVVEGSIDKDGKPIPFTRADGQTQSGLKSKCRYIRMMELLSDAFGDPDTETVVLDSCTAVTDMIIDAIKHDYKVPRHKGMEIQHWQPFIKIWIDIVSLAKSYGKRFILIGHEEQHEDVVNGGTKRMLLLPSKARATIPGMFSDVWECFVESVGTGKNKKLVHKIRCKSDNTVADLKTSYHNLPTVFEADWDEIAKLIQIDGKDKV
ncbi:MAG: hypothetical protein CMP14_00380 [Rickettsiales bacterium]|nr:hypothetical protein [Rickettsiales bacterium]